MSGVELTQLIRKNVQL